MPKKSQPAHANHAVIAAARERDALLTIHAYCPHAGCPTREVEIRVKDYDRELVPFVWQRDLRCPVCGRALKVHEVLTSAAQRRLDDRMARWSVNRQIFERDHRTPDELVLIPASVLCDDTLPGETPGRDKEKRP